MLADVYKRQSLESPRSTTPRKIAMTTTKANTTRLVVRVSLTVGQVTKITRGYAVEFVEDVLLLLGSNTDTVVEIGRAHV